MRLAVITGAAGGVGRACVSALAGCGYATFIVGRSEESLRSIADETSSAFPRLSCSYHTCDLSQRESLEELERRLETLPPPDVFVSAAGITSNRTSAFGDSELDEIMAINAIAPIYLARRISYRMLQAGAGYIINIGSRAGKVGFADKGLYGSSKAASIAYFSSLYAESLSTPMRVTSLCPGWINTKMAVAGGSKRLPNEMLQASDISSVVAWLVCSPTRIRIKEMIIEAGGEFAC